MVTIAGLWSLLSIPLSRMTWPIWVDTAFSAIGIPTGPSLFVAISLLILGSALRRRLRIGWAIAFVFELLYAALSALGLFLYWALSGSEDPELGDVSRLEIGLIALSIVASLLVALGLWLARRAFPARLRRGSLRAAAATLLGGLAAAFVVTFALASLFPLSLDGVGEQARWAAAAVIGFGFNPTVTVGGHAGHHWMAVLAGIMAALALLAAVLVFLRSARRGDFMSAADELAVRALLATNGERDSLGYFATRRDKSVAFAPERSAAVTYRTVASVSLASGDPLGPVDQWPAAIAAWLDDAREHGWYPAVISASEEGARAYVDAGLRAVVMGDEAIVDLESFSLEDKHMRPVRRAVGRVRQAGYDITVRRHRDIPADELAEIGVLADQWRGDEPDRGFSMALNRLADPADGRSVMVLARDAEGRIRGLQSYVPWGVRGVSLDLMRRDPDAINGLNEALVATLASDGPELGIRRASLNFAMFRGVFSGAERVGAGPFVRIADAVLGLASRFWQLESLYRANAKYLPEWVPRYLCFDSSMALVRVAVAAGMAEGFLPLPLHPMDRPEPDEVMYQAQIVPFAAAAIAQDADLLTPPVPARKLTDQQRVRIAKMEQITDSGGEPYPVAVPRSTTVAAVIGTHDGLAADVITDDIVSIVGRVRALRDFGGVCFAQLEEDCAEIQVAITTERTAPEAKASWHATVDIGDLVSVTGAVGSSHRGTLTVWVTRWQMASKCLRPLPGAHAGFTDPEARVRQRYLDLIVNRDSMEMMRSRSRAISAMRRAFEERGFMEVETPMLQAVHGGANARPFRTHINAYDTDLYLRIAPELYLKHLCVGGMSRIFELNRNFRNEGADATHNPEFTSVEAYQAHADYLTMRDLTRELILRVATAVHGEPVAVRTGPDGVVERVRLDVPWPTVTVHQAVSRATGVLVTSRSTVEEVRAVCEAEGVHAPADMSSGELVLELYDALVEPATTMPTFYTDFPLETSPLTRTHRSDPALAERWDLVAWGAEIGTAYSELIDPVEQRRRLTEQSIKAAAGDPEAMEVDEAFLTALEYAMPPTGGLGIGVDRMVMMLTGANIRQTLAFPFVRPGDR